MAEVANYAKLVTLGEPDFIEVKGVTYCGSSGASSLTMANVPYHEDVCAFGEVGGHTPRMQRMPTCSPCGVWASLIPMLIQRIARAEPSYLRTGAIRLHVPPPASSLHHACQSEYAKLLVGRCRGATEHLSKCPINIDRL